LEFAVFFLDLERGKLFVEIYFQLKYDHFQDFNLRPLTLISIQLEGVVKNIVGVHIFECFP
jgi:hypothetical protein